MRKLNTILEDGKCSGENKIKEGVRKCQKWDMQYQFQIEEQKKTLMKK